jgi:glutathione S-transferase
MMKARLITIPFSHYCEKARWALELCGVPYEEDGHLPLFHWVTNRRAGAGRTVPVVVAGDKLIKDSTEIVAWADAHKPGTLLGPPDALALEDDFDRELGPAARRWAYFYLLPQRELDHVVTRGVPRWEARALRLVRPLAVRMLTKALNITPEAVERSRGTIAETFARVAELLRDGRRYLAGETFSVADLTFASLASPVLVPREHPFGLPQPEEFPVEAREQILAWRATPAGKFALKIYAEHRARS